MLIKHYKKNKVTFSLVKIENFSFFVIMTKNGYIIMLIICQDKLSTTFSLILTAELSYLYIKI